METTKSSQICKHTLVKVQTFGDIKYEVNRISIGDMFGYVVSKYTFIAGQWVETWYEDCEESRERAVDMWYNLTQKELEEFKA